MSETRILVGVLPERGGAPNAEIFFDFIAIAQRGYPFVRVPYARTDLQRNRLAQHLLNDTRFTHLLMLDCDHRHPADIVEQLRARVEEDPARRVIGGLAFRRGVPFDPCMYMLDADEAVYAIEEWTPGNLLRVDLIGAAAMLVHRSVFEELPAPWFAYDYGRAHENSWPSEDIWFARRCRAAGIAIYADTGVVSPHYMDSYVDEATFRTHLAHLRAQETQMRDLILTEADLAPGEAAAAKE